MEDEFVRSYVGSISKISVGIESYGETNKEDEILWNILKTLTPPCKREE